MLDAKRVSALFATLAIVVILVSAPPTNTPIGGGSLSFLTVHYAVAAPATVVFNVTISDNGFNDGTLHLVANQGDTVRITFTLSESQRSDTDPDNHHVVTVGGYNVKTADIDPHNPSATVTFVADQLGTFTISCQTEECPIHYLMLTGEILVQPSGQTSTSTTSSTTTSTTASTTTSTSTQATRASSTSSTSSLPNSSTTTSSSTTAGSSTTTAIASTTETSSTEMAAQSTSTPLGSNGLNLGGFWELVVLVLAIGYLAGVLVTSRFVLPAPS